MEEQKQRLKEKITLEKVHAFFRKITPSLRWIVIIAVGIAIGNIIFSFVDNLALKSSNEDSYYDEYQNEDCNVIGINVHGSILTYVPEHAEGDTFFDYDVVASENIIWSIDNANNDPSIKAIIIEVDSVGGYPVAGEEIAIAVKNSEKPVLGFIRQSGSSAAYWAISGADRIWASKNSDVGSIGVTMSYLNEAELNKKEGYTFEQLSSGKFKDSGTPDLPLTKEERDLFMRDVNIIYKNFMEAVSVNRNIPIEKVREIADGSTVLGEKAKELRLIDEIGGIYEVEKYAEEQIGENAEICWE